MQERKARTEREGERGRQGPGDTAGDGESSLCKSVPGQRLGAGLTNLCFYLTFNRNERDERTPPRDKTICFTHVFNTESGRSQALPCAG